MTSWSEALFLWLVDFYVLGTALLAAAFACLLAVRQPARRLAVGWAALGSLALLAGLIALPNWPRLAINSPATLEQPRPPALAVNLQATYRVLPLTAKRDRAANITPKNGEMAEYDLVLTQTELRRLLAESGKHGAHQGQASAASAFPKIAERQSNAAHRTNKKAASASSPAWWSDWSGVVACWFGAGALLAGVWVGLGGIRVRWLCRNSREAPAALQALLESVVGHGHTCPRLLLSDRIAQPVAMGTLRPTIMLPAQPALQAAEPHLEAVLAHEWAHIRRGDLWLLALTRWLLVALYAHPLYWWLRGRIREDQEALADVAAADAAGPIDYAATLLHWVRLGRKRRGASAALALWGKPSELKRRIIMLLNPEFPVETRCPGRWHWGAWCLTGLGVLALSLLTVRPVSPAAAEEPAAKPAAKPKKVQIKLKPVPALAVKARIDVIAVTPPQPKPQPNQPLKIAGRVENQEKKPLPGAEVVVAAWTDNGPTRQPRVVGQTKTDAKGAYHLEIKNLALVRQLLQDHHLVALIGAKGYGLGCHHFQPGTDAVIQLWPEQVIRGRLIDLQGQPAAAVKLSVCRVGKQQTWQNGYLLRAQRTAVIRALAFTSDGKQMMAMGNGEAPAVRFREPPANLPLWPKPVTTDARGRFTLAGIGQNQGVGLQVRDPRFAIQALAIKPQGKDKTGEITLPLIPARILHGTVTDADTAKPIPGARVHIPSGPYGFGGIAFSVLGNGVADWKGRRGMNGFEEVFFVQAGSVSDDLPPIDVQADKQGRYQIPLHAAGSYRVQVSAPAGEPYFEKTQTVNWPKAAVRQEANLSLTRGVWLRGKAVETPAGKPVADARVDFWSPGLKVPPGVAGPTAGTTGKDGTFQVLLLPGSWHVLINGASSTYLYQKIAAAKLLGKQSAQISVPNGSAVPFDPADKNKFFYPDGWAAFDLKPRSEPQETVVKLRRVMLKGKLVGPDGKPVAKAMLFYREPPPISRVNRADDYARRVALDIGGNRIWGRLPGTDEPLVSPVEVRDGNFELPIRDLEAKFPLYFLDAQRNLGAIAEVIGKQAEEKPITVSMVTCGSAKACFVNDAGKPMTKLQPQLWMLLPPGPHPVQHLAGKVWSPDGKMMARATVASFFGNVSSRQPLGQGMHAHDRLWWGLADPGHYAKGPLTDAQGKVTFPTLIAGATYRLWQQGGKSKDFKVEAGKTLDLTNIVIKELAKPAKPIVPKGDGKPLRLKVKVAKPD